MRPLPANRALPDSGCIPTPEKYKADKGMYDKLQEDAILCLAWDFCRLSLTGQDIEKRRQQYQVLIAVRRFHDCQDLVYRLASEIRQHEHDSENIPALITRELTALQVIGASDFTWTVR